MTCCLAATRSAVASLLAVLLNPIAASAGEGSSFFPDKGILLGVGLGIGNPTLARYFFDVRGERQSDTVTTTGMSLAFGGWVRPSDGPWALALTLGADGSFPSAFGGSGPNASFLQFPLEASWRWQMTHGGPVVSAGLRQTFGRSVAADGGNSIHFRPGRGYALAIGAGDKSGLLWLRWVRDPFKVASLSGDAIAGPAGRIWSNWIGVAFEKGMRLE